MSSRHPGDEALEKQRYGRRDEKRAAPAASKQDPCTAICQSSIARPNHPRMPSYEPNHG